MTVSEKATVEVFWKAIGTLKPAERMALAKRILHDRKLLDQICDSEREVRIYRIAHRREAYR